jgi:hypothetical protein
MTVSQNLLSKNLVNQLALSSASQRPWRQLRRLSLQGRRQRQTSVVLSNQLSRLAL